MPVLGFGWNIKFASKFFLIHFLTVIDNSAYVTFILIAYT